MTTSYTPRDEEIVDQLLLETGTEGSAELKAVLLELRSFAAGPPVLPSAQLGELMATAPVSLDARRRRKHRAGIVTLAVVASLGMGSAAVAETDPGFSERAQQTITTVIDTVTHGISGWPAPASGPGSPETPGHATDHQTPAKDTQAKDTPGRSGQAPGQSSAPGLANSGQEVGPSPKPETPAVPGGGQGNAPATPDYQNTRPSTASPPAKGRN